MVSTIFWELSYRWRLLRDYPESECCVAVSVHVEVFARCGEGEIPRYHRVPILGCWQDVASHVSTANIKALNSRSRRLGIYSRCCHITLWKTWQKVGRWKDTGQQLSSLLSPLENVRSKPVFGRNMQISTSFNASKRTAWDFSLYSTNVENLLETECFLINFSFEFRVTSSRLYQFQHHQNNVHFLEDFSCVLG